MAEFPGTASNEAFKAKMNEIVDKLCELRSQTQTPDIEQQISYYTVEFDRCASMAKFSFKLQNKDNTIDFHEQINSDFTRVRKGPRVRVSQDDEQTVVSNRFNVLPAEDPPTGVDEMHHGLSPRQVGINSSANMRNSNKRRLSTGSNSSDDNTNFKRVNTEDKVNLESDMLNDTNINSNEFSEPAKVSRKIAPIIIRDSSISWSVIDKYLLENKIQNYVGKVNGDEIKIKLSTAADHRFVLKYLNNSNINYHTYRLAEDKMLRVVIRSLPRDTPLDDITNYLIENGFNVNNITQMTKRREGEIVKLPLFLVTLPHTQESKQIYNLPDILRLRVRIESYRGRRGPTQCHRCQGFFHTQSGCRHKPRCVKCGQEHLSYECRKPRDTPAQCANCSGDHPANFRNCPSFPDFIQKTTIQTDKNTNKNKTVRSKIYEDRTITNRSYADAARTGEAIQVEQTAQDVIAEATRILGELKIFVDYIKNSGIMEVFKGIQSFSNIHQLRASSQNSNQIHE